jgi:hypothetical protein
MAKNHAKIDLTNIDDDNIKSGWANTERYYYIITKLLIASTEATLKKDIITNHHIIDELFTYLIAEFPPIPPKENISPKTIYYEQMSDILQASQKEVQEYKKHARLNNTHMMIQHTHKALNYQKMAKRRLIIQMRNQGMLMYLKQTQNILD